MPRLCEHPHRRILGATPHFRGLLSVRWHGKITGSCYSNGLIRYCRLHRLRNWEKYMGDDAEYYIEQQEEEARYQEQLRQVREDQITRDRVKRERAIESAKNSPPKK